MLSHVLSFRLCYSIIRIICQGKYDEGNISSIASLLFLPYTPLLQSEPPPAFQTVDNCRQGLLSIFIRNKYKIALTVPRYMFCA